MNLNVFYGTEKCGTLRSTDDRGIVFSYADEYLSLPSAHAISLSLPLQEKEFSQKQCLPFFTGLLPEETVRKRIADYLHISELSSLKLLEALGHECAGYITIAGEDFDASHLQIEYDINSAYYREIPLSELEQNIRNIPQRPFLLSEEEVRLSLAGAQEKLALAYFNGKWFLPLHGAPSTHILKPTRDGTLSSLAKNEFDCMQLARNCGLDVPDVMLETIGGKDVFIVQRYDRIIENGKIRRLHQEDMCQALGIMPDRKYQSDGGPGIKDIYNLIKDHSILPVIDLRAFLSYVCFNYLIGNCDAHAKNYSILYDIQGNARLSPLYDTVSTTMYPGLSRKVSMKIGSHYEIDKISTDDFVSLAKEVDLPPKTLTKLLAQIKDKTGVHHG